MASTDSTITTQASKAPKNFLTAFDHYLRIDVLFPITNPNAPYEVIECLSDSCAELATKLISTNEQGAKAKPVQSCTQWPTLFAFSEQEAQNSAAGRQLRGCLLIGLAFYPAEDTAETIEDKLKAVETEAEEWSERVRRQREFVDELKMPFFRPKVVAREQLGQLVCTFSNPFETGVRCHLICWVSLSF